MKNIKEEIQQDQFLNLEQETHINLVFTANYLDEKLESILTKFGLDLAQYNILRILDSPVDGLINIKEIQQRMIHKMANTSRLIKALEERDLITRNPSDKDKRVVNVSMTNKGEIVMEQISDLAADFHEKQLAILSEDELKTLNHILNKIRAV